MNSLKVKNPKFNEIFMSLEDLKTQNVLLPEKEWGSYELKSTVNKAYLFGFMLLAVVSLFLMFIGDGSTLTWLGLIGFFCSFIGIITSCSRAVTRQKIRSQNTEIE